MPWYIIPFVQSTLRTTPAPMRELAITVDFPTFKTWREVEVLGNRAIVKVRVDGDSPVTLAQLNAAYKRMPEPDTLLSDTSAAVRTAIRNELSDMGYTTQEVNEHLPNPIGTYTMRQVMNFMRRKRRQTRWDQGSDTLVLDGAEIPCENYDVIDKAGI